MSCTKSLQYATSFFNSEDIRYWANEFAALIPEGTKVIVSTGSSGCSIASAMLMICEPQLRHCYFGKDGSHNGGKSGVLLEEDAGHIVIVDDFVSTGDTIRRIMKGITSRMPRAGGVGHHMITVIVAEICGADRYQVLADSLNLKIVGCDKTVVCPTVTVPKVAVPEVTVPELKTVKSVLDFLTDSNVKTPTLDYSPPEYRTQKMI